MRDASSIDPMWERGDGPEPTPFLGPAWTAASRALAVLAPHLLRFAAARRPQLRVAWGARELHVRRDGLFVTRRGGVGWEENPRTNYVDGLRRRQERAGRRADGPDGGEATRDAGPRAAQAEPPPTTPPAPRPAPEPPAAPTPAAPLDLSPDGLRRAVDATMGRDAAAGPGLAPEQLKDELARLRAALSALDAVKDWKAVEALDDELYKLHKAVEYTMRNHKASEAKSKLESLFK